MFIIYTQDQEKKNSYYCFHLSRKINVKSKSTTPTSVVSLTTFSLYKHRQNRPRTLAAMLFTQSKSLNNLGRRSPKNRLYQIILKSDQLFLKIFLFYGCSFWLPWQPNFCMKWNSLINFERGPHKNHPCEA